jgi:hypothetical protein
MLANLTISIFWLPLIVLISVIAGFFLRRFQVQKSKKRIIYLENEMLSNHAEILKLQQELATIEKNNSLSHKSRVVPMKDSQEGNTENPETSPLKKIKK